jgi:hypothetical protein
MTIRIAVVNGSADELEELAAALDDLAVRHQRAAMTAAVELEADETVKDKRAGALAIFKTLAEAGRFTTWASEIRDHRDAVPQVDETEAEAHLAALAGAGVPGSTVVPAAELGLELPDHAPETAPTRDEVLAGVAAHVAAVNGDDPDDPPTPEELEAAKAAALEDDGSDPVAEDGDR